MGVGGTGIRFGGKEGGERRTLQVVLATFADLGPGWAWVDPRIFIFLLVVRCEIPQDAPYRVGWGLGGLSHFI